ncbi:hypothetical protein [Streptomyces sp. NPDC020917]|uniref:hypothetical protein n=1 Tax=Streptomyces sp. NPDC020917 TaxID=3365102 RepID=UPI00379202DF
MAAVGAAAGCSGGSRDGDGRDKAPAPGTVERARAARDSLTLLGQYDAALAAHPGLAGRLTPLRAQVALHASAFGGRLPAPAGSATPSASSSGRGASGRPSTAPPASPTPRPGAPSASPTPQSPAAALAALAAAERALADRRAAALLTVPGELARLMASVAAAGAAHVVLLTPGAHTA